MAERARLAKTLKPQWVWAIAVGSAVGWGSFVLPTDWMSTAGPLGAVLGLLIGGALMIVIAVSYGFMIEKVPVSGGEFAYSFVGFGRNHAYLCGWFLTLGYLSIVALNASALALLCRYMLPAVAEWGLMYQLAGWDVYFGEVLIASLALVIFAWLNIRGAALSGRLQFGFVLVMIAGAVLVSLGAFLHPESSFDNLTPAFSPEVPAWSAVLAIVAIAPWAYVGFDNVPQAAEEFNFAPRKAYRLIVLALVVAALFYAMMVLATAVATPWQDLVASEPRWGTGDAVAGLFGAIGTLLLFIAVCMGIFTGLNGFFMASSRLTFAMGRARILPRAFARLHTRYRTPYVGIMFCCALCLITPWFGREALLWVVDMSAVGVAIAYAYTCFVAFRLFRGAPVKRALSLLGGLFGLGFVGLLLIPASPAALGPESLYALGTWLVLGAVFYLIRMREYRAVPKSEMEYLILDTPRDTQPTGEPATTPQQPEPR